VRKKRLLKMEVESVCVVEWIRNACVWLTGKKRQKNRHCMSVHLCVYVCPCVCIRCVGETTAQSLQNMTAADEDCRPPDEHSDHSSERLSQRGNKKIYDTGNMVIKPNRQD